MAYLDYSDSATDSLDPHTLAEGSSAYLDYSDTSGDGSSSWLRKLAQGIASLHQQPAPATKPSSDQGQDEKTVAPTAVPAGAPSRKWMTQAPGAIGKAEKSVRQTEATSSLAHSLGVLVRLIASYGVGGAAGGAAEGAGVAEDAGAADASAGAGDGGFGANFGSAFKGGEGSGIGGALGRYARARTGGVYGQGGQGGFNVSALGNLLGKQGGGGGGGGMMGGGGGGMMGGGGGDKQQAIMDFISAPRRAKAAGLLALAEGGGLVDDAGGTYFQG